VNPLDWYSPHVAESIPLKQGLKLLIDSDGSFEFTVAESIPLKQGLKPVGSGSGAISEGGCGEHSIKTRIET